MCWSLDFTLILFTNGSTELVRVTTTKTCYIVLYCTNITSLTTFHDSMYVGIQYSNLFSSCCRWLFSRKNKLIMSSHRHNFHPTEFATFLMCMAQTMSWWVQAASETWTMMMASWCHIMVYSVHIYHCEWQKFCESAKESVIVGSYKKILFWRIIASYMFYMHHQTFVRDIIGVYL